MSPDPLHGAVVVLAVLMVGSWAYEFIQTLRGKR